MECRFCLGSRVVWRNTAQFGAHTFCQDCRRRNCECQAKRLPHGPSECARAQLQLKML